MGGKRFSSIMRMLHRDIGYLMIGLTIIYIISGISLIYRDTNFLKFEKVIERQLEPNLNNDELGRQLWIRGFRVDRTEGDTLYFNNGTYNLQTGVAEYKVTELPTFFNKINHLHKTASKSSMHWLSLVFAILLFFMALSSFWMYTKKTKYFKRGLILSAIGVLLAVILVYI